MIPPSGIDKIILWDQVRRSVPPRPANPLAFPETDARRWWDYEYAGWSGAKKDPPRSPGDGPSGKRILALLAGEHPYFAEYERGMRAEAERRGIELELRRADWDAETQSRQAREGIAARPDLVVLVPVDPFGSAELARSIHEAGIPLIASNLALEEEAYPYVICWTGPDDWGQYRLLARRFAERLGGAGGYCVVTHRPGSSPYYARFWGLVTELAACAPEMECLDARFTRFDRDETRRTVAAWLERFGGRLRGIVCADDGAPQEGVNLALAEAGRSDVVRVANGATRRGLEFLRDGSLFALTWQPPELDGALPIAAAADWFSALELEPVRYLPRAAISAPEAAQLLGRSAAEASGAAAASGTAAPGSPAPASAAARGGGCDELCRAIAECRLDDADKILDSLEAGFAEERIVDADELRGAAIEFLAAILAAGRSAGVDATALIGGREMLSKGIFRQSSPASALAWLRHAARSVSAGILERSGSPGTLVDRLRAYAELHYAEPLSLKTLSDRFGLTAAYLGKAYKEGTGQSFSFFLNQYRIGKARALLEEGRMTAKEVAHAVGYAEPNYFYAMFRKITGRNPSDRGR